MTYREKALIIFAAFVGGCTNGQLYSSYYNQRSAYSIDFYNYSTLTLGTSGYYLGFGDFQNNGSIDYVIPVSGSAMVSTNDGSGSFSVFQTPGAAASGRGVVVADFNSDGFLDFASVGNGTDQVQRFYNVSGASFSAATNYAITASSNAQDMRGADFDLDGDIDLVVAQYAVNNICILTNGGGGNFGLCTIYLASNSPKSIRLDDLNSDGDMDIAVLKGATNEISVFIGSSGNTFNTEVPNPLSTNPSSFDIADFDLDGKKDILVAGFVTSDVAFVKGNGDGTFQGPINIATGPATNNYVAAGDLDGDGYKDFVLVNDGAANNIYVFRGYGNGTFSASGSFLHAGCSAANNIYLKDVNFDGRLDVFVVCRTPTKSISVFLHK